jgi:hypothetical protein
VVPNGTKLFKNSCRFLQASHGFMPIALVIFATTSPIPRILAQDEQSPLLLLCKASLMPFFFGVSLMAESSTRIYDG